MKINFTSTVFYAIMSAAAFGVLYVEGTSVMQKVEQSVGEIKLVGLSARTNNFKNEMDMATSKIVPVNQQYFQQQLATKIPHRTTPGVTYCVYTAYESDYTGDYTYFIGERVDSFDGIAAELQLLTFPAQAYAKFTTGPGPMPDVVRNAWMDIWKKSPTDFGGTRAYVADFELYDERASNLSAVTLDIYIGIKQ